jgi:type IV secretion system protein VirB6
VQIYLIQSLIHDTYSAMDEFGHAIVWMAYDFFRDTSISDIGMSLKNVFTGALIIIVGGIFLAASAILIISSKIGFAIAVSLAPLAIVLLMTDQTKHHFESWMRFAVGFVVIPILTSALMTIVLYVAAQVLLASNPNSFDKSSYFGFMFTMIAAHAFQTVGKLFCVCGRTASSWTKSGASRHMTF